MNRNEQLKKIAKEFIAFVLILIVIIVLAAVAENLLPQHPNF